jgi:hypothetical protein
MKSSCYFFFSHSGTSELKFFWTHSFSLRLTRNCLERILSNSLAHIYIAEERTWVYSKHITWSLSSQFICSLVESTENTASSIVACWTVFTELLPGNAMMKSVTSLSSGVQVNTIRLYSVFTNQVSTDVEWQLMCCTIVAWCELNQSAIATFYYWRCILPLSNARQCQVMLLLLWHVVADFWRWKCGGENKSE